jgi:hypothetical protein
MQQRSQTSQPRRKSLQMPLLLHMLVLTISMIKSTSTVKVILQQPQTQQRQLLSANSSTTAVKLLLQMLRLKAACLHTK